jgi:hypothetical protein
MNRRITWFVCLMTLSLFGVEGMEVSKTKKLLPSAMATLSRRGAKPRQKLELVVTIRNAKEPAILSIDNPPQILVRPLRRMRLQNTPEGDVWLARYWITAMKSGDYEIPPIRLIDAGRVVSTKPLLLHVSKNGDPPVLTPRELSLAIDIPPSLSEEVLKVAPQPTPKPEPTPAPRDPRLLPARVGSSILHGLKAFWNYGG